MHKRTSGFTIVELLIVIVVIGVLAAVTFIAYNGLQKRARDSIRKSDLAAVAKALSMYQIEKGDYVESGSGCGMGGTGEGWLSHKYTTYSPSTNGSVIDCLRAGGYLKKDVVDPSGCFDTIVSSGTMPWCGVAPISAYMKVNCTKTATKFTYLLARLESESMAKPADLNNTNCTYDSFWTYDMNYAVRVG